MSKKKHLIYLLFLKPVHFKHKIIKKLNSKYGNLFSVGMKKLPTINNTAWFFKKLAFIGLAYSNLIQKRYRIVTIKSVMASLWNMIAAHVNIF